MNNVILIGNLTKDPEHTTVAESTAVCKFTVAVSRKFANREGNKDADFIPLVVWRGLADNCAQYLKKGSKVAVKGSLQTRTYEQEETRKYITEVVADEVQFLSQKEE